MIGIVGIVVLFVMVFGGYLAAGGKMSIILNSLPYEMTMIGGAAMGALVISNSIPALKHTFGGVKKVFKGPHWKPDDYRDLLCLLYQLMRLGRQNAVALEEHTENPRSRTSSRSIPGSSPTRRGSRSSATRCAPCR